MVIDSVNPPNNKMEEKNTTEAIATVAIVLNAAWNLYNYRLGLARYLLEKGFNVLLIAPLDEYVEKIKKEGFRFIPIHHLSRKGMNPLQDVALIRELRAIYKREAVNVALQYTIKPNIYGSIAAAALSTKTICTVTGLGYTFLNKGIVSNAAQKLYKYAFERADRIFFQNPDDYNLFIQENLSAAEKCSVVSGSGVDISFFHPDKNLINTNGKTNFIFVGRLLYDKGIRELMRTIESVLNGDNQKVHFTIVGKIDKNNPAAIKAEEWTSWLHKYPSITYVEHTDDIRSYYATADAVILPSYREGMPRVLLEGLAMGKPLIATDVPGCRETIEHEVNGFLVHVQDSEALTAALQRFLSMSQAARLEMGFNSRARVMRLFDEQAVYEKYYQTIQSLLG